jgi:hypothetical protein
MRVNSLKFLIVITVAIGFLSACKTIDRMTGPAAVDLENKVVGKWQGKWDNRFDSTVTFSKRDGNGLDCTKITAYAYVDNTVRFSWLSRLFVYTLKSPDSLDGEFRSDRGGFSRIKMTRIQE